MGGKSKLTANSAEGSKHLQMGKLRQRYIKGKMKKRSHSWLLVVSSGGT